MRRVDEVGVVLPYRRQEGLVVLRQEGLVVTVLRVLSSRKAWLYFRAEQQEGLVVTVLRVLSSRKAWLYSVQCDERVGWMKCVLRSRCWHRAVQLR